MDIWSANSADISFVISFSSPNGAGLRGRQDRILLASRSRGSMDGVHRRQAMLLWRDLRVTKLRPRPPGPLARRSRLRLATLWGTGRRWDEMPDEDLVLPRLKHGGAPSRHGDSRQYERGDRGPAKRSRPVGKAYLEATDRIDWRTLHRRVVIGEPPKRTRRHPLRHNCLK
jgi:hypothetical protein